MPIYIRRFPFVVLTIPLILGIILGDLVCLHPGLWIPFSLISLLAYSVIDSFCKSGILESRLKSFLLIAAVLGMGSYRMTSVMPKFNVRHFSRYANGDGLVVARIQKLQQRKCEARVFSVGAMDDLQGKVLINTNFELPEHLIHDLIYLKGKIVHLPGPLNPTFFNARRYYFGKGIFHQVFISKPDDWGILERDWQRPLLGYLARWREKAGHKLSNSLRDREVSGVVNAMILGDKGDLNYELRRAYAHVGVAHLLAISGLHVGIIYLALRRLLFLLPVHVPVFLWIRTLLILGGIWAFSLISGGAVPVIRAATMFSVFQFGNLLQKRYYNLNNLAFVAFVFLVISPYSLWDIGFQLTFLAVAGIILGYPAIAGWFVSKNSFIKYIWSLTAVSLSAQILILPILLNNFHAFPTLFLVSSILLIPLTAVLIGLGVCLILIPGYGKVSSILSQAVDHLGHLMHSIVRLIQGIPFSSISGIWVDGFTLCLLCCASLTMVTLLRMPSGKMLILLFCLPAAFLIRTDLKNLRGMNKTLGVYYARNASLIQIFAGRECFEWNPDGLTGEAITSITRGLMEKYRIKSTKEISSNSPPVYYKYPLIGIHDKRILILDGRYWLHDRIKVDYVIIRDNPSLEVGDLERLKGAFFIIDSSNDRVYSREYEKMFQSADVSFHNVLTTGGIVKKV